jgi:hypothetical protein
MNGERAVVAVVQDAMSLMVIPGGSIAGLAIETVFRKRAEAARDIILEEIRQGRKTINDIEVEEAVAILERYLRAAKEGAARLNLRLMAKVIAGQKESQTLTASEFLYHAEILASLRREEILLLATMYKHSQSPEIQAKKEEERGGAAMTVAMDELVPSIFKNKDEFRATAGATMRTGLMIGASGWGSIVFSTSPLMEKLYKLAPFEAALAAEPS